MPQTKFPEWFVNLEMPSYLRKHIASNYTIHRDGYVIWHEGQTVFICGKKTPPEQVDAQWELRRKSIGGVPVAKPVGTKTIREALSEFYEYMDHRVKTGKPEPLSETTQMDYEKTLTRFARVKADGASVQIADRLVGEIGQNEFAVFAKMIGGGSATSFTRHVAYVQAFFRFCKDEGIIQEMPQWGRYFVKPAKQQRLDERMSIKKSFNPTEIKRLIEIAKPEEKAWIWLGINCAFDNSDLSHLTRSMIASVGENKVIDYRRRKVGKIPRVCPLLPETIMAIKAYVRPPASSPEYEDLFFLTPTGLPLVRPKRSKTGKPGWINYVAMQWARLLRHAGLRAKASVVKVCKTCGNDRPAAWGRCDCGSRIFRRKESSSGGADRRGFRALRTTFPNLAPRGLRDEIEIVMGHANGILLENYLEEYGHDGLWKLVNSIADQIRSIKLPPQMDAVPQKNSGRNVNGTFAKREARKLPRAPKPL